MNTKNERIIMLIIGHHLKRNSRPQYLKRLDAKLAANGLARSSIQRRSVSAKMNKNQFDGVAK